MSVLSLLFQPIQSLFKRKLLDPAVLCPVCNAIAPHLDSVDLNKSCEEARGLTLPNSGVLIRYHLCDQCGFCFAPEFSSWTFRDFEDRIYNEEYERIDPDYKQIRPTNNAELLVQLFGTTKISHLDYGGGSGLLSETLQDKGWDSQTYDPFVNRSLQVDDLGQFDSITAFEVFEHVPNIDNLFDDLKKLLKAEGFILFSTLLSDGEVKKNQSLHWWYASPRNGHISLFSSLSLGVCLEKRGFTFGSVSSNLHFAYRKIPVWASHLFDMTPNA